MGQISPFKLKNALFPLAVFALFFSGWEMATRAFHINSIFLPAPSAIFSSALKNADYLFPHFVSTAFESVLGLALAFIVAFAIAALFVYSRNAKNAFYPFAIALKATPIIAIAPLIILWLGSSLFSMAILAALIAFFPILVNGVEGLESIEKEKIELFKTLNASRRAEFFKLRLPSAMPFLFSSLKIASTLAVVGAIIGEFTGSGNGIGYVIVNASYYFDIPLMFAAILLASLWGIVFFAAVGMLETNARFFQKLASR